MKDWDDYSWPDPGAREEDLCEDAPGDPFHIGPDPDGDRAQQTRCKKCGGVEFHVGQANWFTAIRCVKCRWELCFHRG